MNSVIRVLHLSDLHAGSVDQPLAVVWDAPSQHINAYVEANPKFDYIVVSGDLVNRSGSIAAYEETQNFIRDQLVPLLRSVDLGRIVVVPGNHDVDRAAVAFKPVVVSSDSEAARVGGLAHRKTAGAGDPIYRLPKDARSMGAPDKHAAFNVLAATSADYPKRFIQFQQFYDSLYRDASPSTLLVRMDTLGGRVTDTSAPWSLHGAAEDGILFCGFNSCTRIDQHSISAYIDQSHIAAASQRVARRKGPRPLVVAVWHHGLASDRGLEDLLTFSELHGLSAKGFSALMHGHVHKDQFRQLTLYAPENFLVVATGSLGAPSADRPAVGNRFSIVEFLGHRARIKVFGSREDGPDHRRYGELKFLRWSQDPVEAALFDKGLPKIGAEVHERKWRLRADGRLCGEVKLTGIRGSGHLVILDVERFLFGHVTPLSTPAEVSFSDSSAPYGRVSRRDDLQMSLDVGPSIERSYIWDSRRRIRDGTLNWSFQLAPGAIVRAGELNWRALPEETIREFGELAGKRHGVLFHVVRFPQDKLEIVLESETDIRRVKLVVHRPIKDDRGQASWQRVKVNGLPKVECTVLGNRRVYSVKIFAPRVGSRYSLIYRCRESEPEPDRGRLAYVDRFLLLQKAAAKAQRPLLTAEITEAIERCAETLGLPSWKSALEGHSPRNAVGWTLFLWSHELLRLVAAAGACAPEDWGIRLSYGRGVGGVAFRMRRYAIYGLGWKAGQMSGDDYYVPLAELVHRDSGVAISREWLLAIPLLSNKKDHSLGVLTLYAEPPSNLTASVRKSYGKDAGRISVKTLEKLADALKPVVETIVAKGLRFP